MTNTTRRAALKTLGATIGATCASFSLPVDAQLFASDNLKQPIRIGVITDLHGGLAVDAESRLDSFLKAMQDIETDALVQLGDFAYPNQKHQLFADKFNSAHENTVHVIGNHEFDFNLTREDCYKAWGIKSAYYVRDLGNLRLIVLDGNETGSPTQKGYPSFIGHKQKEWLEKELKAADRPLLILSHQPLAGVHAVQNAGEIQVLLTRHQHKILLCINGHTHVDSLLQVDGVTYLHVNSASYYWVGGKTRMAYYKDPLFTTLTIDPEKAIVTVESKASTWTAATQPAMSCSGSSSSCCRRCARQTRPSSGAATGTRARHHRPRAQRPAPNPSAANPAARLGPNPAQRNRTRSPPVQPKWRAGSMAGGRVARPGGRSGQVGGRAAGRPGGARRARGHANLFI